MNPLTFKAPSEVGRGQPCEVRERGVFRPQVVYLKNRNFVMLKKDLILRNPLRLIGRDTENILTDGEFGAILARAGVGKTAFLVQLALNSLLRQRNVLHISLNDPVKKVVLWYDEVLTKIAAEYRSGRIDQLLEAIQPHRFIMTFRVEGFSAAKLEERLTDLTEQGIFSPQLILIDGLPFDETVRESLISLKTMARKHAAHLWFAVRTHRHQQARPGDMPPDLLKVVDLFDVVIQLRPEGEEIYVTALKGGQSPVESPELLLDPSTMLIRVQDQSEKR